MHAHPHDVATPMDLPFEVNEALSGLKHTPHDPFPRVYQPTAHSGYGSTRHELHRSNTPLGYVLSGQVVRLGRAYSWPMMHWPSSVLVVPGKHTH